ncbi:MAG: helix-turn-helix transcriptional regulator [Ruminococcaceae bacterium]|nr:helix-turn-helix transcriptional regulator [Oscillospiraceae bacterium]
MQKFKANSFPLKLKMLRLERGKSQEILSAELGISRSCLANYETGKRQPDAVMLAKIASALHVDVDCFTSLTLFYGTPLREAEAETQNRFQKLLQSHEETLDIAHLSTRHKLSMLAFYDYIKSTQSPVSASSPAYDAKRECV